MDEAELAREARGVHNEPRGPFISSLLAPLKYLAAVLLIAVMSVTVADVIGRYVLGIPLPGSYQIITGLMALMIFAGLPIVSARDEHLKAGLFEEQLTGTAKNVLLIIVDIIMIISLAVLAWRCAVMGSQWQQSGEMLGHAYSVPLYVIAYFMTVLSAVTIVVIFYKLLRRSRC